MLFAVGASDMCAIAFRGGLSFIWLGGIHIGLPVCFKRTGDLQKSVIIVIEGRAS